MELSEAIAQRCSREKVFWNDAANLQEKTHAEVWFQSNFIKITLWHGLLSYKFVAYFRNTFS